MGSCLKATEVMTRVFLIVLSLVTLGVGIAEIAITLTQDEDGECSATAKCLGPPVAIIAVAALAFVYESIMLLVGLTDYGAHSNGATAITDLFMSLVLAIAYAAGSATHSIWPMLLKEYFDMLLDSSLELPLEGILALSTIILGFVCVVAFILSAITWGCMCCCNSSSEEAGNTTHQAYEMPASAVPVITSPLPPPPIDSPVQPKPPSPHTKTTAPIAFAIPAVVFPGTTTDEYNSEPQSVHGTDEEEIRLGTSSGSSQHFKYQPNIYVPSPFVPQKDLPSKYTHNQ